MVARRFSPAFTDRIIGNVAHRASRSRARDEQRRKIDACFRVALQEVSTSDQFIQPFHAQLRQPLAHLPGYQCEVIDEHLWRTREFGAQVLALCRNACRTGIQAALASHVTAQRYQAGGAEATFFRPPPPPDHHVPPRPHTTTPPPPYTPSPA